MKFEVFSRWTGALLFTAEIDCAEDALPSVKLGLAVKWAFRTGASLAGARLDGASLVRASLVGARLDKRTLRSFKADLWMILAGARAEIPGLVAALEEGRVDGRVYEGECACLVGTIANVRGVSVEEMEKDSYRPAEQWFFMIKKGDKPGDKSGGGFASAKAVEWIDEFVALSEPSAVFAE